MPDPQTKVTQRDEKYWIKPGVEVAHREYPGRKMIVDDILKKTETVVDENGKKFPKTFVVGVECHWWDPSGRYDRGRFLTMELSKWGQKTQKSDPESFPKHIPTSDILD